MQRSTSSSTSAFGLFSSQREEDNLFSMIQPLQHPSDAYKIEVMGSDPKIGGLKKHRDKVEKKFAVIGVSGARSIEIACKLSAQTDIPKIVIVDKSKHAMIFWKTIKEIAKDSNDSDLFIKKFNNFFYANQQHFNQREPLQCIDNYFAKLFKKYTYDFVRKMIANSDFICQGLENKTPLTQVKSILRDRLGINSIVMYSSNVIACYAEAFRMSSDPMYNIFDVMKSNIESINPNLHIFVDAVCTNAYIVSSLLLPQHALASTASHVAASAAAVSSTSNASGSALSLNTAKDKPANQQAVNTKDEDNGLFGGLKRGFLL